MRIEPKVLDDSIEKKSLHEKGKSTKQPDEIDSYACLFGESAEETLSHLEVIDDEDRQKVENMRAEWGASELGRGTISASTTEKLKAEQSDNSLSYDKLYEDFSSLLSDEDKKKIEEAQKGLESLVRDAF